MSSILVSINFDVLKLKKERFFKGEKGTYCELTCRIDLDNPDQYGNSGMVKQSVTKEERDWEKQNQGQYVDLPILGNSKVLWKENQTSAPSTNSYVPPASPLASKQPPEAVPFDDDIPF